MADFPWDVVFWAVLAVAMGSAVFYVLGRRMGAQALRQEHGPAARPKAREQVEAGQADTPRPPPLPGSAGPEMKATEYGIPAADSVPGQALAQVARAVDGFSAEYFLKKAEDVFARTIRAFACADRAVLETTLAPAVLADFSKVLDERRERQEQVHLELRRIERLDYLSVAGGEEAGDGSAIRLEVGITSWQVSYVRDSKGAIVEGTEALTEFRDLWTFGHEGEGQWKVVATAAD